MNKVKTALLIIGIMAIIILFVSKLQIRSGHYVDWNENYNERSNKPYGTSVLYKELPRLFDGEKIKTIYYSASTYFYANSEDGYGDHIAAGNFVLIGHADALDSMDIDELLNFTSLGNTLFLSDYDFPQSLLDTLNLDINVVQNHDSIAKLSFNDTYLTPKNTTIDRSSASAYFSNLDVYEHYPLGYVNDDVDKVNFVEIPFEDGTIFLHLEPKVFTNYNILKDQNYLYTEGALSYLPDDTIYFDSYTKFYGSPYDEVEKESNLSWFLQQRAFKWATYLTLIFTLLFIIFNAKRRQRIIPILKPLDNTTVGFVKTISNLYFETQDHENLIEKKITYFLEKIRSDYYLDTATLNEEFIAKLSQKSGKKKETVKETINFITWIQAKKAFNEENLLKLNRHIEKFYS